MAMSLFAAILPYLLKSHKHSSDMQKNAASEFLTLIVCNAFVTFNITDIDGNFLLGYFLVGFIGFFVAGVILYVLATTIKGIFSRIKRSLVKRAYAKKRKLMQASLRSSHARLRQRMRQLRSTVNQDLHHHWFTNSRDICSTNSAQSSNPNSDSDDSKELV